MKVKVSTHWKKAKIAIAPQKPNYFKRRDKAKKTKKA